MKAKELKEILATIPDENLIEFYIVGVEHTDEEDVYLGEPQIICSNGIDDEGCVDFGFKISSRKKIEINRLVEVNDKKRRLIK